MKHYTFLFLAILIAQFSTAQITQTLGDFDELSVFDKIPVTLVKSDKNSVEISGAKSEDVQIIQKNKSVKIRMKLKSFLQGNSDLNVTVYYKNLNNLSVSEGSTIGSNSSLTANRLVLDAKEGAEIHLNIDANLLDVKTNSGGKIILNGNAQNATIVCNTGGSFLGKELDADNVEVTVNAGGEAHVYATNFVDAKTRAGGNIHIYGNPEVKEQKIVGGKIYTH